ncbi:hypothetical protein BCR42DRAFT_420554 [Absidia repens]|uniref:Uncharacterized protein n=1 Tax=Absidia repens TaxID=90262 RepID=A0A1X2I9Y9_9FUNG|nr:hypothetical protein BCR42DRAFT_420554 [Absidia repens]
MAQVNTVTFVLILLAISLVFLSGLFWCFCCGTCVGRSLLRQTPFSKWTRDNRGYNRWDHYGPLDVADEEEQWTLDDWEEHLVDDDDDDRF